MLNSFKNTKLVNFFDRQCSIARRFFSPLPPLVYADDVLHMNFALTQKSILVLPPSYYWTLETTLNVKNEKEAAKYGAALFDLSDSYHYAAQKVEENKFILIAYNPNELFQDLFSKINLDMIEKITFSQWVFNNESNPIKLNNGKYLTTLDGIVIEIDPSYLQKNGSVPLSEALSKIRPYIKILLIEDLVPSEITPKTLKITLVVLLILMGNFLGQILLGYQESIQIAQSIQEMQDTSHLPETSIERETILNSLRTKEKNQLHFRHLCNQINTIPIAVTKNSDSKLQTAKSSLPAMPEILTASAQPLPGLPNDGVVLIPGSTPDEPNRLLVNKSSHLADLKFTNEGIEELTYDGHTISVSINTHNQSSIEKLKNEFSKRFKNPQINERNTQLEVRLK